MAAGLTGAEEAEFFRVAANAVQVRVGNFFPEVVDGQVLLVLGDAAEAAARVLANDAVDDHALLVAAAAAQVAGSHVRSCWQPGIWMKLIVRNHL